MSFQGIYSIYYKDIIKSDKKIRLANLFKTGPFSDSNGVPSGIEEQRALEVNRAMLHLTPNVVTGNPMFQTGVDLTFGNSPNTATVAWEKAGDPSSPYTPDQRSPGNEISATAIDTDVSVNFTPVASKPEGQVKRSDVPNSPSATKHIVKIGQTLSLGSSDPTKSFT